MRIGGTDPATNQAARASLAERRRSIRWLGGDPNAGNKREE
jgi:hypothetical protein